MKDSKLVQVVSERSVLAAESRAARNAQDSEDEGVSSTAEGERSIGEAGVRGTMQNLRQGF